MSWEVRIMPLKTSSSKGGFSAALLRSDLTRFWPLWAAYTTVWLLAMPAAQFLLLFRRSGMWELENMDWRRLEAVSAALEAGSGSATVFLAIAACLFAMALFSYLTTSRSVGFAHALPVKREGLFLTHYAAGAAVFLTVHVAAALLTLAVWAAAGVTQFWAVGAWFLSVTGQMLFFYSFAVFCAMFAGQVLAVPAFYTIFNLLAAGLTWIFNALASQFLYGWAYSDFPDPVRWLTPVWALTDGVYSSTQLDANNDIVGYTFTGLPVVAAYAAAGVVLAALALAVYRRRASETAGDLVAIPWAKPLFRYGMGFCGGLLLGMALYSFLWNQFSGGAVSAPAMAVCAVAGGLAAYFGAEMLLRKSFRVVKASWRGAAALCAALVLVCAGYGLDLLKVESRVPQADQVRNVYFQSYGQYSSLRGTVEDPALIEQLTALHQTLVQERPAEDMDYSGGADCYASVTLQYALKNGGSLSREYSFAYSAADLKDNTSPAAQMAALFREPGMQMASLGGDLNSIERVTSGELEYYFNYQSGGYSQDAAPLDAKQAQTLLDAFIRDVQAGHAGVDAMDADATQENSYVNALRIYYVPKTDPSRRYQRDSDTLYLSFTTHYTELLAELEKLGLKDDLITTAELDRRIGVDSGEPGSVGVYEALDEDMLYVPAEEDAIGIIGGADGPTAVFVGGAEEEEAG